MSHLSPCYSHLWANGIWNTDHVSNLVNFGNTDQSMIGSSSSLPWMCHKALFSAQSIGNWDFFLASFILWPIVSWCNFQIKEPDIQTVYKWPVHLCKSRSGIPELGNLSSNWLRDPLRQLRISPILTRIFTGLEYWRSYKIDGKAMKRFFSQELLCKWTKDFVCDEAFWTWSLALL